MYSWGQIRLLLQQFAPGVSLDTIDEKINARYALILTMLDWKGLETDASIETLAAITTGTATATQGSAAVQGQGTAWTAAITGMQFVVPGCSQVYTATWLDATDLMLDRPFEGPTSTAGGYTLLQSIYPLPSDCRTLRTIESPVTGLALEEWTPLRFAQLVGFPVAMGDATMFVPQPDLLDPATGLVLAQQILLYPMPILARGYPLEYERQAPGFDGASTSSGPLDFVSDAALLSGCRADLAVEKGNVALGAAFEAQFAAHFRGMLHVEARKREPQTLRMAPIYTQHRVARILRGFGGTTIANADDC